MFTATARKATAARLLMATRGNLASSCRRSNVMTATMASTPRWLLARSAHRSFSTQVQAAKAEDKPIRDFFLDNMGKIFLGAIAAIVLTLVRSSYGTTNMKNAIAEIEESSALDPLEIDELRKANGELTPDLFRLIMKELSASGQRDMAYEEFVRQVRTILVREKGDHCTIGMGFLLDRVVIAALKNGYVFEGTENENNNTEVALPLPFWLTVLSLALNGPVPDRIRVLYEVLEEHATDPNGVTLQDVTHMVRYLQETCQLSPDKQVVETETKYPTQQYRRGTPEQLVQWGEAAKEAGPTQKNPNEVLDIDAFADILRSKSVCAWGECYFRKKHVP